MSWGFKFGGFFFSLFDFIFVFGIVGVGSFGSFWGVGR